MLTRLLIADLRRSPVVTLCLLLLLTLVATLVSASTTLLMRTGAAIDQLWRQALPPDIVQMHSADIDAPTIERITEWAASRPDVADVEVMRTIPAPGSALWIAGVSQDDSVLEPAFVTQSRRFDLLVDAAGNPLRPQSGQIALPIHYLLSGQAKVGGLVEVRGANLDLRLEVIDFVRDAQMNSSIVMSKRLVVSPEDFKRIDAAMDEVEHLVEMRLTEGASMSGVLDSYVAAGLPAKGIGVDRTVLQLVNGLSTMLVAAIAILLALLLGAVCALALGLAVSASLEADMPRIAALRVIGAPGRDVMGMLLAKNLTLAVLAALLGHLVAMPVGRAVDQMVLLPLGTPPTTWPMLLLPVVTALVATLMVLVVDVLVVRRVLAQPVLEALRGATGAAAGRRGTKRGPSRPRRLATGPNLPVPVALALRGALSRRGILLAAVLAIATVVSCVPANLATTLSDPRFATFLGIGQGVDVRLDVRADEADLVEVATQVDADPQVRAAEVFEAQKWEVPDKEGQWASLPVEAGQHATFPLRYEAGAAPGAGEVALSHAQAEQAGVTVGQSVRMRPQGGEDEVSLRVSGIYSDVTNGGRTAKVTDLPAGETTWQLLAIDLVEGADSTAWADDMRQKGPGVKVSVVEEYASQTMGATRGQTAIVAACAAALSLATTFLVLHLAAVLQFLREAPWTRALLLTGVSVKQVRRQRLLEAGLVALVGIVAGVLLSRLMGGQVLAAVLSAFGAPGIELLADPFIVIVAAPLALLAVTLVGVGLAVRRATNGRTLS
ncbi:ABC transporter permease [Schaalia sp. 19OD2882]|uniref:FtsX-like permease family protein n=1 Tax=Schaalia sp. 19OD2882 TaxID=2794089 RepID=UPI001C1F0C02|nr:ABC transporter permease [Schaalia sp. 19OD2882]QWW19073.1 ABC transporter permease [Schaalia sp. 19OD2882]